jgi:hypothetical protein
LYAFEEEPPTKKTATSQAVAQHSRTFNARLLRLPERQEARLHNLPVILAFKVLITEMGRSPEIGQFGMEQ